MSLELRDQRVKISIETDVVLETVSRVTGRERSEICRQILHDWAVAKLHEYSMGCKLAASEGICGQGGATPK